MKKSPEQLSKFVNILFHEIDAQFFDKEHKLRHKIEKTFWTDFINTINSLFLERKIKILDVASGTGFVAKIWLKNRSDQFYCADITLNMLKKAREQIKFVNNNLHFVNSDVMSLPFKNDIFDVVLINAALHHIPNYRKALLEMARVTKPKGILVIAHEPNLLYYNSKLNRLILRLSRAIQWYFSPSTYINKLKKVFKICQSREDLITNYINKKLASKGYKTKLNFHQILEFVDVHSADEHLGFSVEEIITLLSNFDIVNCLFFDYCGVWLDNTNIFTKILGKLIKTLVGETLGRRFTLVLKKNF